MTYFSRLIEQSQLAIDRPPLAETKPPDFEPGQLTDIVEIDAIVDHSAVSPARPNAALATPASALHADPAQRVPPPVERQVDRSDARSPVILGEQVDSPAADSAIAVDRPLDAPVEGQMIVQRVLAWVRGGAVSDAEPVDPLTTTASPEPASRGAGATARHTHVEAEVEARALAQAQDETDVAADVPVALVRSVEPIPTEVEPPVQRGLTSEAPHRAPIEERFEVSIGSINVRLEAPAPVREPAPPSTVAPASVHREPTPMPTRLSRHYLRV